MKGSHHPRGSQKAFLTGLAHLYNFIPYQSRAQHAGHCGVEVEGGTVPTRYWFLNLRNSSPRGISLSGDMFHHVIRWNVDYFTTRGLDESTIQ